MKRMSSKSEHHQINVNNGIDSVSESSKISHDISKGSN